MVSKLNPAQRSVTVEWYERGETKGKEVELDMLLALNQDLMTTNRQTFVAPAPPAPVSQIQAPINLQRVSILPHHHDPCHIYILGSELLAVYNNNRLSMRLFCMAKFSNYFTKESVSGSLRWCSLSLSCLCCFHRNLPIHICENLLISALSRHIRNRFIAQISFPLRISSLHRLIIFPSI